MNRLIRFLPYFHYTKSSRCCFFLPPFSTTYPKQRCGGGAYSSVIRRRRSHQFSSELRYERPLVLLFRPEGDLEPPMDLHKRFVMSISLDPFRRFQTQSWPYFTNRTSKGFEVEHFTNMAESANLTPGVNTFRYLNLVLSHHSRSENLSKQNKVFFY